ncbi:MAG TPA: SIS domain-containing protein [Thermoplasmata archaeon]|nr:SIS domain-containing protein [Thermoplasmata archaeon]
MDLFPAPESPKLPDDRHRHPFHMYEMIRRQPIAARTTLTAVQEWAPPALPAVGRVLFTGIGTSYHAALALARAAAGEKAPSLHHALAVPAFELRNDPPGLDDIGLVVAVSASGDTDVTLRAARKWKAAGVPVLAITATEKSPLAAEADAVLATRYADEASFAHTVSYTAALVAGLALLAKWAPADADRLAQLETLPDALTAAVASEGRFVDVAERWADRPHWFLAGSGPRAATVREACLKLREAAGRFAAPVGIEELLHGPFGAVDDKSVVIALTGTALEAERARQGIQAAQDLGAETLHLDSTPGASGPAAWTPEPLPGPLAPVVDIVPFQFLAYWMAVSTGRNPDVIGYDDPRHRTARSRYGL